MLWQVRSLFQPKIDGAKKNKKRREENKEEENEEEEGGKRRGVPWAQRSARLPTQSHCDRPWSYQQTYNIEERERGKGREIEGKAKKGGKEKRYKAELPSVVVVTSSVLSSSSDDSPS